MTRASAEREMERGARRQIVDEMHTILYEAASWQDEGDATSRRCDGAALAALRMCGLRPEADDSDVLIAISLFLEAAAPLTGFRVSGSLNIAALLVARDRVCVRIRELDSELSGQGAGPTH